MHRTSQNGPTASRLVTALATALVATALAGCSRNIRHITTDAVLGRVVIYRNGIAFYERTARVVDGTVSVLVPRDRVDDFLKSLTVVDPLTRKPLAVSIPRQEAANGSYLTMSLEMPDRQTGTVLMTYVTEAPAWKPSYRVVVGPDAKVMLEGWAIVDNVSGEDWKGVLVGVGASSALAFRYDLWSVRRIDRDLLEGEERFAIAPPTGMSPYDALAGSGEEIVALDASEVRADAIAFSGSSSLENRYSVDGVASGSSAAAADLGRLAGTVSAPSGENLAGVTVIATSPSLAKTATTITAADGSYSLAGLPPGNYLVTFYYDNVTVERSGITVAAKRTTPVLQKLRSGGGGESYAGNSAPTIDPASTVQAITIDQSYVRTLPGRTFESIAGVNTSARAGQVSTRREPPPIERGDDKLRRAAETILARKQHVLIKASGTSEADARKRGEAVKNKLVNDGIPASRIRIEHEVGGDRIRVLAIAPPPPGAGRTNDVSATGARSTAAPSATGGDSASIDAPVGESHFIAERPMNVRAGTSAMVAMVQAETAGGIVYLYDPLSDRGDERFAFKAVRLDNPTDDTLEPGPVTVYGDGRFIGEGITEPVPPRASVVVPFALDRQIVVSSTHAESDHIAKLVTVQRGILTAEVQHRRNTRISVTSRLSVPTKVYLRHRLQSGWSLVEAPPRQLTVGDSQLFEVDLAARETKYVTIAEATPVERQLDLAAASTLDMMKVYVDEPDATPQLKTQLGAVLATHRDAVDLADKITALRDQLAEYRSRSGELHAQIVTLKAVRTGGELMSQLKTRLGDMSARVQKTTIAIVDTQEKLMLARVKFQNQLADLRLVDTTAVSAR
jgi:hypothetical protein